MILHCNHCSSEEAFLDRSKKPCKLPHLGVLHELAGALCFQTIKAVFMNLTGIGEKKASWAAVVQICWGPGWILILAAVSNLKSYSNWIECRTCCDGPRP